MASPLGQPYQRTVCVTIMFAMSTLDCPSCDTLRIGVIDNDACASELIVHLVRRVCGPSVSIWQETLAAKALQRCRDTTHPTHILLVDMALNGITGDQVARAVRTFSPTIGIIGMTAYDLNTYACACAKSGMQALLDKSTLRSCLADALHAVLAGGHYPTQSSFPAIAQASRLSAAQATSHSASLTQTELHIITLSLAGNTAKQIASQLGITAATVYSHHRNINAKLRTRDWNSSLKQCRDLHIA